MRRQIQNRLAPLVYLITDRRSLPHPAKQQNLTALSDLVSRAAAAGVDMVQIRELDLAARDLFYLTQTIIKLVDGLGVRVLVNDRADIAACTRAGVHLTTRSLTADVVRAAFGSQMLVGVSTHSLDEARAAEGNGADFVVFGPVFETPSKQQYGEPQGVDALARVAASVRIPVLALGGISRSNYRLALDAGAGGVAGISMFTGEPDLTGLVASIKAERIR